MSSGTPLVAEDAPIRTGGECGFHGCTCSTRGLKYDAKNKLWRCTCEMASFKTSGADVLGHRTSWHIGCYIHGQWFWGDRLPSIIKKSTEYAPVGTGKLIPIAVVSASPVTPKLAPSLALDGATPPLPLLPANPPREVAGNISDALAKPPQEAAGASGDCGATCLVPKALIPIADVSATPVTPTLAHSLALDGTKPAVVSLLANPPQEVAGVSDALAKPPQEAAGTSGDGGATCLIPEALIPIADVSATHVTPTLAPSIALDGTKPAFLFLPPPDVAGISDALAKPPQEAAGACDDFFESPAFTPACSDEESTSPHDMGKEGEWVLEDRTWRWDDDVGVFAWRCTGVLPEEWTVEPENDEVPVPIRQVCEMIYGLAPHRG